jgi:C4-dicarboxylate-specific signal transduction histidine kinase
MVSMSKSNIYRDHIVVVGIPINNLKKMQEELKIQTSKAEYSARLATLGEMAGGIAHEINNPLAVIMGNSSQIIKILASPSSIDQVKEKAQKIISTSQRISKIIHGLRQFSRQGDHDPFSPTSLRQVLDDTLELCRERFYRFEIKIQVQPVPEVLVPARAVQISQVILNILNNAADAVQETAEKFIEISFKKDADFVSIFIQDSGPGVSPTIAQRIFQPFFTTKEVGRGTGLGLSISKGIMDEHQGELLLVAANPMNKFEIKIPLKRKSTESQAA